MVKIKVKSALAEAPGNEHRVHSPTYSKQDPVSRKAQVFFLDIFQKAIKHYYLCPVKLRLFIVISCCCFVTQLKAQDTTTTIHILESDYLVVGGERKSWIINGVFQHENATMRCDSTFLDSEANTLEAYEIGRASCRERVCQYV